MSTAQPFVSRRSSGPLSLTTRTATAVITAQTSEVGLPPFLAWNSCLTNISAFLSYLRLSIYMAIVSVAIILSFHLRKTATEIELRMARPLGAIFWILSVACLGVGMANYISASLFSPSPASLLLTQPRHGQQVQPSRGFGPDRMEDSRCKRTT
jgi:hypothetical protein